MENACRYGRCVDLDTGRCPTLDWAIQKRSVAVAKFVLDYLAERHLTVQASCSILTNYLLPLSKEFPYLVKDYLENDRFSFEYGRFSVPHALIEKNGRRPIAMTTDNFFESWNSTDNATTKRFWTNNCEEHSGDFDQISDFEVTVAAKFFCVDQHLARSSFMDSTAGIHTESRMGRGPNHVLRLLSKSSLPVEIFKSESLKAFANWLFYSSYYRCLCLVALDVLTAGLFSFFAVTYGLKRGEPGEVKRGSSLFLITATFALSVITLVIRHSKIKCADESCSQSSDSWRWRLGSSASSSICSSWCMSLGLDNRVSIPPS